MENRCSCKEIEGSLVLTTDLRNPEDEGRKKGSEPEVFGKSSGQLSFRKITNPKGKQSDYRVCQEDRATLLRVREDGVELAKWEELCRCKFPPFLAMAFPFL
ncbi:hypothetical protein V6N12_041008 [Hibiscus sabdariffa]|uniref:Uncharacterized protein n=1 Tax=Hibiscus sabdariffa TaxID=183260 RepID=A0ABR2E7C2_9ROSI